MCAPLALRSLTSPSHVRSICALRVPYTPRSERSCTIRAHQAHTLTSSTYRPLIRTRHRTQHIQIQVTVNTEKSVPTAALLSRLQHVRGAAWCPMRRCPRWRRRALPPLHEEREFSRGLLLLRLQVRPPAVADLPYRVRHPIALGADRGTAARAGALARPHPARLEQPRPPTQCPLEWQARRG